MKTIIIQGSARSDGNTNEVVNYLSERIQCDFIDLRSKEINHFDYQFKNGDDDFMALMREMVEYDLIIFATPVYWYTMSGILKVFMDRMSDCLNLDKELFRKLKGKNMAAISCGSNSQEINGFFTPFQKSAEYMKMDYLGHVHTWKNNDQLTDSVLNIITEFANDVMHLEKKFHLNDTIQVSA